MALLSTLESKAASVVTGFVAKQLPTAQPTTVAAINTALTDVIHAAVLFLRDELISKGVAKLGTSHPEVANAINSVLATL